jgi:hypothetical protein
MKPLDHITAADKATEQRLAELGLLPIDWPINTKETGRLAGLHCSLSLDIDLPEKTWPAQFDGITTVKFSPDLLDESRYDTEEFIASMLHEIGHALLANERQLGQSADRNPMAGYLGVLDSKHGDQQKQQELRQQEELYCDEFAFKCGFGEQLKSALMKFIDEQPKYFQTELTTRRLKALKPV